MNAASRPRVRIDSADQLFKLPGYVAGIDPTKEPMLRVVTNYFLSPMIPCGLKSCRQPHNDGFVVELGGGRLTNVGHVCGQQFGAKFAEERQSYTDRILRPELIQRLGEVKSKAATMQMELHSLRSETNLLCERINAFRARFSRLGGDLVRRAHNKDHQVYESVARSQQEIDDLVAATPGSRREQFQFKQEHRGRIPGLTVFGRNLRDEIVAGFVEPAEALLDADLASTSTEKLLRWDRWFEDFAGRRDAALGILAAGAEFFTPATFALLAYLSNSKDEASELRKLTIDKLFKNASSAGTAVNALPALTKRERDAQKKLNAILRTRRRG